MRVWEVDVDVLVTDVDAVEVTVEVKDVVRDAVVDDEVADEDVVSVVDMVADVEDVREEEPRLAGS